LTPAQLKKLREMIAKKGGGKSGPGASDARAVAELFKRAEAAFKDEKFAAAYEYYVGVAASKDVQGVSSYATRARAKLLELERAASAKLDEARLARIQGRGPESLATVREILEKYPYTRAAEEARGLLAELSNDPRVAAAVALLKAEELDAAGKYAAAVKAYSALRTRYPDSVESLKAKLRIKAIRENPETAKAVEEAEKKAADTACPKMLLMARNYSMNGMYPQARGLYKKLISKYPESDYASQARKALEEIAGKEKQQKKAKATTQTGEEKG
jgi:tetratricopeptide (TPR) repeat protein